VYVAVLHYYTVMCRCMYLYHATIQWCVGVCTCITLLCSDVLVYVPVLHHYTVMCMCISPVRLTVRHRTPRYFRKPKKTEPRCFSARNRTVFSAFPRWHCI